MEDKNNNDQQQQIVTTLQYNVLIFVVLILFFEFNRSLKSVYLKRYTKRFIENNRVPDLPSNNFFSWLYIVIFTITEEELYNMIGLDAYILIRYLNILIKISLFVSLNGLLLLAPLYYYCSNDNNNILDKFTIGTITANNTHNSSQSSSLQQYPILIPIISIYMYSSYYCYLFYNEYKLFNTKRLNYLIKDIDNIYQVYYTIIVERLPNKLRNEINLYNFFNELFPNDIFCVELMLDLNELDELCLKRKNIRNLLEKNIAIYNATKKRPLIYNYKDNSNMDAIEYYYELLKLMNDNVMELQKIYDKNKINNHNNHNNNANNVKIKTKNNNLLKLSLKGILEATRTLELLTIGAYYKTSSTAFVTFKTRKSFISSIGLLLSYKDSNLIVNPAPNPKDIIYENISIPYRQILTRSFISNIIIFLGLLFWSFVVGFIATISNLEFISNINFLTFLQKYNNTTVYIFLNNYLALLILLILLTILPFIFDIIARNYEGLKLESEIQNTIMNRYFYYQLANVFVSLGLGSIINKLHDILNNPYSIFTILGQSLPSFSQYFMNLLIIKTFTAVPVEMLRLWTLFEILFVKLCRNKKKFTRRELRSGPFEDPKMLYGWIYPNLLMVLMIMTTYCCISPLLIPFCSLFYIFSYVMYKYQLLYIYINDYQSGGYMWYQVFYFSMVALIMGIVTLLCYLGIRQMTLAFYLLLPLPFFIILFWRYTEAKFKICSTSLSLESAKDIDLHNQDKNIFAKFNKMLFRQPSLVEGPLKPALYRRKSSMGMGVCVQNSCYNGNNTEERRDIELCEYNNGISTSNNHDDDDVGDTYHDTHIHEILDPSDRNNTDLTTEDEIAVYTPITKRYTKTNVIEYGSINQSDDDDRDVEEYNHRK